MQHLLSSTIRLTVATALAAFPQGAGAEGHNSQATLGSRGANIVVSECPAGEVLVGFTGRAGAGIDQIQLLCAAVLADGTYGAPHPYHEPYGGFGGAPVPPVSCDRNTRIFAAKVVLTVRADLVAGIDFTCVDRNNNPVKLQTFAGTDIYYTRFVTTKHLASADYRCPDESFTGMRIRFDNGVRGIGMLCDRRSAPPPPPALKPIKTTGKARPAPPPVLKPIKTTGKARPSGPPLAPRVTIGGSWKMTAGDDRYNLVLAPQGQGIDPFGRDVMPMGVAGQLAAADDPADAGGVQGVFEPTRIMTVSFGMKGGASGTCQLNYASDGQSLAGNCVQNGRSVASSGSRGAWPARAAAPAEPAAAAPAAGDVNVKLDVDVYAAPGGEGNAIASLNAGTPGVALVGACRGDWCHVKWGGGEGWVYSGSDYNSLGR